MPVTIPELQIEPETILAMWVPMAWWGSTVICSHSDLGSDPGSAGGSQTPSGPLGAQVGILTLATLQVWQKFACVPGHQPGTQSGPWPAGRAPVLSLGVAWGGDGHARGQTGSFMTTGYDTLTSSHSPGLH